MGTASAPAPDERKYIGVAIGDVEADGTFEGYASLFGKVDLGRDVVERGAFAASLEKRGAGGVRMLFQHNPNAPIGSWTEIREDARGLFVRGRLALEAARAREVHSLLKDGALDGLSIGFRTVRARTEAKTGIRRIIEVDLWEISVVTFPMLPEARIDAVKARRFRNALTPPDWSAAQSRWHGRHNEKRLIDAIRRATRMLKKGTA
jgi:HK97 family phage prohead protease